MEGALRPGHVGKLLEFRAEKLRNTERLRNAERLRNTEGESAGYRGEASRRGL